MLSQKRRRKVGTGNGTADVSGVVESYHYRTFMTTKCFDDGDEDSVRSGNALTSESVTERRFIRLCDRASMCTT